MEGRHMLLCCVHCLYINMLLLYYIHYKKNIKYRQNFTNGKNYVQFIDRFNSSLISDGKLSVGKLTVNLPTN